jgi:hypothetical protein
MIADVLNDMVEDKAVAAVKKSDAVIGSSLSS